MKTELKGYTIYFDGVLELGPDQVPRAFMRGVSPAKIRVKQINKDIEEFNKRSDVKIQVLEHNYDACLDLEWKIPESYLNINIEEYVFNILASRIPEDQLEAGVERLEQEFIEFQKRDLFQLLKAIIFIFDTFRSKKVVWGVGRGSSCASYILHLIGVHSVDPIKFNIPLSEFFHD